VIGAGAGKLLHPQDASKLEEQAGGHDLRVGGARPDRRLPALGGRQSRAAVTRAIRKSSASRRPPRATLKGALADAQQKMAESGA